MAGTVTQTHERIGAIGVLTFSVIGDAANGSVPDTVVATKIGGKLLAIEADPGTPAPTDNYDVTLVDAEGHDVLEGVGVNRDAATTEKAAIVFSGTVIHPPVAVSDVLTLKVANNIVNSAETTIKIYYEGAHA